MLERGDKRAVEGSSFLLLFDLLEDRALALGAGADRLAEEEVPWGGGSRAVPIGREAAERLAVVAERTGIPRATILEALIAAADRAVDERGGLSFPLRLNEGA
jgi:hypothetical protein